MDPREHTPSSGNGPVLGPPRPGPPVLEVEDLRTEFHLRSSVVRAVDGVSFSVAAGECVGLVGESGCGKSTTGLSIMKLLPDVGHVSGGSVRLLGKDLVPLGERDMREVRGNDVAMIFQDPMTSLNPTWTIGRQIGEAVKLHRDVSAGAARERAIEVLTLVGMPRPAERLAYYPHQLSGGLRQRVMIAMALACEPKVLIADEPTTALDVTIQAQILDLIDELRERLAMAVLLITHDMGVIAARTSRVMVMYAGKIVEGATTTTLFDAMHHPYAEALLDAIPRLDQDRDKPLATIPGLPPDLSRPIASCRFAPRCRYVTDRCRAEEPLLAPARPGDQPGEVLPSPTAGGTGTAQVVVAATAATTEHVFACFHPVSTTSATRQAAFEAAVATSLHGSSLTPGGPPEPARPSAGPAAKPAGRGPILELRDLVKEYPVSSGALFQRKHASVKAVSGVSLSVERGETFGLVGESGCGKTTIGRLIVALERPSGGTVRFEGEDLGALRGAALRAKRAQVQLMFQDPYASLDPRMRVRAIVGEPLVIQHVGSRRSRHETVDRLLVEVGLPPRALALSPRLIVADEPVSALDVSIQAQMLNLMRSLQAAHGLSYVIISHDLAVIRYVADRIGVMYLGKLVELGTSAQVYERPAHPYTQGLIDAVPIPDPRAAKIRGGAVRGELPSAIDPPSGCRYRTRCPLAQARCAEEEPVLRAFGPGHLAACHFPLQDPLDAEMAASPLSAADSAAV